MVLYTIISPEVIFDGATIPEFLNSNESQTFEIDMDRRRIITQMLPNGQMKVDRLISSDPQDYLNPNWQPGTIL